MAVDILENCENCYPFTLSEFPAQIIIEASLNPLLQYYFKVTDKFQNSFVTELIRPDVNGGVTLNVTTAPSSFIGTLPAAWFNKNAGRFYIEASLTTDIWEPVELFLGATPYLSDYTCIVVEFVNDDSEKNTIL